MNIVHVFSLYVDLSHFILIYAIFDVLLPNISVIYVLIDTK